uniref:Uncharacterized protein n=1 Tax=Caenorhabditis japonica TaxID=281687 RepID=A0A8R1I8I0_CAEJA
MALANIIENFPHLKNDFYESGWDISYELDETVSDFLSKLETLPAQFTARRNNLKDIGEELAKLNSVPIIPLNFPLMVSILESLKSTPIGVTEDIKNAEESLQELAEIQYAARRQSGQFIERLTQAERALRFFFRKPVTSGRTCRFDECLITCALLRLLQFCLVQHASVGEKIHI